ncbi:hypothetical protein GCM10023185_32310 [Hymenobacter saemangeumensis]|uniref:histidine kinase n=1 Tax=Hymenobacter saemangeumensis TaxID=1084522 RepID=A0ABP8IN73_9BACT
MSLKLKIRLSIISLWVLLMATGLYALYATGRPQASAADARLEQQLLIGLLSGSTLLALLLAVRLPRQVTRPLRRLVHDVEDVAGPGPATRVSIRKNDEVGSVAAAVNRVLRQAQNEQRATLAALITERNRMDSLVSSLDEGLLVLDAQGVIVLANPVACDLLGLPATGLLGQPAQLLAASHASLRAWMQPLAEANLAGDDIPDPVFTYPHKGPSCHYQLSISVIKSQDHRGELVPDGHILCLRNVSDFKKLDELKSNFLATISHELKTPLSSINLSLMLLQDERTDAEERQRIAAGIREETQRLLGMVGQLIDVSRLDAGAGIKLNVQVLHLAEVIRYATDTVRPQLEDKQLQLALEVPENLPPVQGDVEKTTWVLTNLLANAIRFSPPGAPLLIRAMQWGEMVRLSVHDQGPGIPTEYHKRIFQRFAGVPTPSGHSGGSGLGLSISHEFISAQGGLLWVESKPDLGSCFLFTLPQAN